MQDLYADLHCARKIWRVSKPRVEHLAEARGRLRFNVRSDT